MTDKTYSVAELEQEFLQDFPELQGKVTFIDTTGKSLKDVKKEFGSVYDTVVDEIVKQEQKSGHVEDPKSLKKQKRDKIGTPAMYINAGIPFAQSVGPEIDSTNLTAPHYIVFGGGHDLTADKILWRLMIDSEGKLFSLLDEKFGDAVKKSITQNFPVPKALQNQNMLQTFFIDHECGHVASYRHIAWEKIEETYFKNYLECIADSYALIRHYQRYGQDSEFGETWSALRTMASVMNGASGHLTSKALDKVIDLNKKGVLKDMPSQQVLALALKIAGDVHLDIDEAYNITKAFKTSHLSSSFKKASMKVIGNKARRVFNKTAKKLTVDDFVDDFTDRMRNAVLSRANNKNQTILEVANIAMKTKSIAVYQVASDFLKSIDKVWTDIDTGALDRVRKQVETRARKPNKEPKRPVLARYKAKYIQKNLRK